jgi:hypothetical protein
MYRISLKKIKKSSTSKEEQWLADDMEEEKPAFHLPVFVSLKLLTT